MRRPHLSLVGLTLAAFTLAACGGGSATADPPSVAADAETDTALSQVEQSVQAADSQADEQNEADTETDIVLGTPIPTEPIEEIATQVTAAVDRALAAQPIAAALTPRISGVVLDDDPDSPVAASIVFGPDDQVVRVDFFGPKVETGQSADFALLHLQGIDQAIRLELGPGNIPVSAAIPDLGELQFTYTDTSIQVQLIALDGTQNGFTMELNTATTAAIDGGLTARSGDSRAHLLSTHTDEHEPRPPLPDTAITITRGTRLSVLLEAPEPLPPGLAPFVRVADCTRGNLSCSFWIQPSGNFWSVGVSHTALAVLGLDSNPPPPDWPDQETCENARTSLLDWAAGIGTSTVTSLAAPAAAEALAGWLASLGITATAGPAVVAGAATPVFAAAFVGATVFAIAAEFSNVVLGNEIDCSTVIRRTQLQIGLLAGVQFQEFTVEVCFPAVTELTYAARCQNVGPYRPFDGQVELGALTFTAEAVTPPLEITALSVQSGRAGQPVGAGATARGGEPPHTFIWNAPDALNPAGDTTDPDGAASFTFLGGGRLPLSLTVRDAAGEEITAQAVALIERLVDVTAQGSPGASTTFASEFNAFQAIDGSISTSWFSAGSNSENGDVSRFVWTAPAEQSIGAIRVVGNGAHSNPAFRTGFGFQIVTVQVLDAGGNLVWQDSAALGGSPDPTVNFSPDVDGLTVVLIFGGHEDPNCGGFGELSILSWQAPDS